MGSPEQLWAGPPWVELLWPGLCDPHALSWALTGVRLRDITACLSLFSDRFPDGMLGHMGLGLGLGNQQQPTNIVPQQIQPPDLPALRPHRPWLWAWRRGPWAVGHWPVRPVPVACGPGPSSSAQIQRSPVPFPLPIANFVGFTQVPKLLRTLRSEV